MEQKLFRLFDFQRFSNNASLQHVIDSTAARYDDIVELEDDDLLNLAAAGDPALAVKHPSREVGHDRS